MLKMLFSALGFKPELAKPMIENAINLIQGFDTRLSRIEAKLNIIIPDEANVKAIIPPTVNGSGHA